MKFLRHSLTFVLGMMLGIIILVLAIGGTVFILGTQKKVGDLQSSLVGKEIISSDSQLYDQTVIKAVQSVLHDYSSFDQCSLKELYERYGFNIFKGVVGLDFTSKDFYEMKLKDIISDPSKMINEFTLNDINGVLGGDVFGEDSLPILKANLDVHISTAIKNILGSINGNISIRSIKDNLGIDLGIEDNKLIRELQNIKVSDFGNIMNALRLDYVVDADTDTFIVRNEDKRSLYRKVDRYEEIINNSDLTNKTKVKDGAKTYVSGAADNKMVLSEVRYVKNADGEYIEDISCFAENFNATTTVKFYRFLEYEKVTNPSAGDILYVEGFANKFEEGANGDYALLRKEFVPLADIADKLAGQKPWMVTDGSITPNSRLHEVEDVTGTGDAYIRVHEGEASPTLQVVAYMSLSDLANADDMLSSLTIGDLVPINEDTSKLVVALKDSTLSTIGEDINGLSIGEIIDITSDEYTASSSGKYVYIEEDGCYVLYNPAVHTGFQRFDRIAVDNASSALLQRFAGATIGGFSNAFDDMSLADVMQIDADVYKAATAAYIKNNPTARLYYYDTKIGVYLLADEAYRDANKDAALYYIETSGASTNILKKLAFVKVNNLADAMDAAINDMMVSELIDIYREYAIELVTPVHDEQSDYFIEYSKNTKYSVEIDGKPYVYVLDSFGDYTVKNYTYASIESVDKTEYRDVFVKYEYVSYNNLDPNKQLANAAVGNLYYENNGVYSRDIALCNYLIATNHQNLKHVYCRQSVSPTADLAGHHVYMSKDGKTNNVYVKDPIRGYIAVSDKVTVTTELGDMTLDVDLAAFAGLPYYVRRQYQDNSEVFILIDDLPSNEEIGIRYSLRQCETVYVISATGNKVYVDGQYVDYQASAHAGLTRFEAKVGYIANVNEVYYEDLGTFVAGVTTAMGVKYSHDDAHKKSAAVLRLLASGTIGNMSSVIENATVGDIIETDGSGLFGKPQIRNAKLTELDKELEKLLTNMTIGELLEWSNIDGMDPNVKALLKDVLVSKLILSLTWDSEKKTFSVDMLKLFGYTADEIEEPTTPPDPEEEESVPAV